MTSVQSEQRAKDAEGFINIRALCDNLTCKQMACLEVLAVREWWVQKGKEFNLWNHGDEDRVVIGGVKHDLATTPPEVRCRCNKGVVWRRRVNRSAAVTRGRPSHT